MSVGQKSTLDVIYQLPAALVCLYGMLTWPGSPRGSTCPAASALVFQIHTIKSAVVGFPQVDLRHVNPLHRQSHLPALLTVTWDVFMAMSPRVSSSAANSVMENSV